MECLKTILEESLQEEFLEEFQGEYLEVFLGDPIDIFNKSEFLYTFWRISEGILRWILGEFMEDAFFEIVQKKPQRIRDWVKANLRRDYIQNF